ncbi:hypothetical protein MLD38_019596 [Melastoma candidum]|uniref:Uncharacterized protein n=1 Tax=Melastoma candidum TaxID=119954 RepID=A0ACB9QXK8_9MYRT|nr:hypothetical protein MLD38_019596 [Melastoma candidum]
MSFSPEGLGVIPTYPEGTRLCLPGRRMCWSSNWRALTSRRFKPFQLHPLCTVTEESNAEGLLLNGGFNLCQGLRGWCDGCGKETGDGGDVRRNRV